MSIIDSATLALAEKTLHDQSEVPLSPAAYDSSDVLCLCAAGILARSGLHFLSLEEEATYLARLTSTREKSVIKDAFRRLAWSQTLCDEAMGANDRASASQRKRAVARFFEGLQPSSQ